MARPSLELISALRRTARNLQSGSAYQWGHMGGCNCGHLAQELTHMSKDQIHSYAMQRYGDWSEQTEAFCSNSQLPIDIIISEMLNAGLTLEDLKHLEKLDDQQILSRLPLGERYLRHNVRADVIKYLITWANVLEDVLLEFIKIPIINTVQVA